MRVKSNESVLRARVLAVQPEPDGFGAEVQLEILENESPSPSRDFLRSRSGSVVSAFYAQPSELQPGDEVRIRATLNAGPFGGRNVIKTAKRVASRP